MKNFNERVSLNAISEAMETETIQKNGASPKSQTSRGNLYFNGMVLKLFLLFMAVMPSYSAFAQLFGPPTTQVILTHPPMLGLKVNKIVFNQATGECSDQIINELITLFVSNNVEVIDRDNLSAILREQNFSSSDYIDQATVLSIGKIIGPSAMITAKVLNCKPELTHSHRDEQVSQKDKSGQVKKYTVRIHYATLKINLKVSLQTVDLTTGRIFAAKIFDASQQATTQAEGGNPVPPDEYQLREKAFRSIVSQVNPLYFPWTETVTVAFFRDKIDEKGSKSAWDALKVGNYDGATDLANQYLEWCKDETNFVNKKGKVDEKKRVKSLSHAYYNLGVMGFIVGEYDMALKFLQESQKLLPADKYIADAINDCNKAKSLEEENQRIDHRSAAEIVKSEQKAAQVKKAEEAAVLTNDDIISLTKQKLGKSLILKKISTSKCNFDTSTDALLKLTKAGVAEDVISAMMEK